MSGTFSITREEFFQLWDEEVVTLEGAGPDLNHTCSNLLILAILSMHGKQHLIDKLSARCKVLRTQGAFEIFEMSNGTNCCALIIYPSRENPQKVHVEMLFANIDDRHYLKLNAKGFAAKPWDGIEAKDEPAQRVQRELTEEERQQAALIAEQEQYRQLERVERRRQKRQQEEEARILEELKQEAQRKSAEAVAARRQREIEKERRRVEAEQRRIEREEAKHRQWLQQHKPNFLNRAVVVSTAHH